MIMVVALQIVDFLISVPFNYYFKFHLDKEFNNQTVGSWIKEMILGGILTAVFIPPVIFFILWVINETGDNFVIWIGSALTIIILFFYIIVIRCIRPMMNKFDPIEDNLLKRDLEQQA